MKAILIAVGSMVVALMLFGAVLTWLFGPPPSAAPDATPIACAASSETAAGRQAAQQWCDTGLFTTASVDMSAGNLIALLQFTPAAQQRWETDRAPLLRRVEEIVRTITDLTGYRAVISFFDADGHLVGGCTGDGRTRPSCR